MNEKIFPEINFTEIGKKIKTRRKELKLTQAELATMIFKTESSIRKYEKGLNEIPLDVLINISDALKINIWNLIDVDRDETLKAFLPGSNTQYQDATSTEKERKFFSSLLRSEGCTVPITTTELQEEINIIAKERFIDFISGFKYEFYPIGKNTYEMSSQSGHVIINKKDIEFLEKQIYGFTEFTLDTFYNEKRKK